MASPENVVTVTDESAWDPLPVIEWLSKEGRNIQHADKLLVNLSTRLLAEGAPVRRIRISFPILNPAISLRASTWWRGEEQAEVFQASHDIHQSPDYKDSPVQAVRASGAVYRRMLRREDHGSLHPVLQQLVEKGITDYLVIPLTFTFEEKAVPWILATDRAGGFTEQDVSGFKAVGAILAPVLEVLALYTTTKSLLNTYLGERSGQRVLEGQVTRGDGELIEAVIWYSDMRDSTAMTEALSHTQLLSHLNSYFEIITACVNECGGEVLRFVGDALLVVFPGSQYANMAAAGMAALEAARKAHMKIAERNEELSEQGLPIIRYGLGLDVGTVIYGNVGARDRLDFTVMGSAVNRAARIESLTKVAGCSLLVSEALAQLLGGRLQWKGLYPVPGLDHPLSVFCAKCGYQELVA